jgi:SAM-dependent methyltransferase
LQVTSDHTSRLIELYRRQSKHSEYQVLAPAVARILGNPELKTTSREEALRLDCIRAQLSLDGATLLDIGGNTGYFTFSAIEHGAGHVDYFEGEAAHADFVRTAALALGLDRRISVHGAYFDFDPEAEIGRFDLCFCLNVVHHFGDDFGDQAISIESARSKILSCINALASMTDFLVLQIGFNWKGNTGQPLFEHGLKSEMIEFVSRGTRAIWDIREIQVAHETESGLVYSPANGDNLRRFDHLGEFLNRPIFFMKSRAA